MACHDDFGHGAHAHGISAETAVHLIFCRRFVSGSLVGEIHAFHHADAFLLGNFAGEGEELLVVGFAHVEEAGTVGEVLAAQGVLGQEVDVVGNKHHVAYFKIGINSAGGIAHKEVLDTEFVHHAFGKGYFFHCVAFVVMETPFERHHLLAAETAKEQAAAVSLDGADRKVGDFVVRECVNDFYLFGQTAKACAEHDGGFGTERGVAFNPRGGFLNGLQHS